MSKHAKHLQDLRRKSEVALSAFTDIEQQLKGHSVKLADTISAIDTEISELQTLKASAQQHYTENQTILDNIDKLLRGGNTDGTKF